MDQLGLFGEEPAAPATVEMPSTSTRVARDPEVPKGWNSCECWLRTDPLTGEVRPTIDRQADGAKYEACRFRFWDDWNVSESEQGRPIFRQGKSTNVRTAYGMECDHMGKVIP